MAYFEYFEFVCLKLNAVFVCVVHHRRIVRLIIMRIQHFLMKFLVLSSYTHRRECCIVRSAGVQRGRPCTWTQCRWRSLEIGERWRCRLVGVFPVPRCPHPARSSAGRGRGTRRARSRGVWGRSDSERAPQSRTGSHQGGLWAQNTLWQGSEAHRGDTGNKQLNKIKALDLVSDKCFFSCGGAT